VGIAHHNILGLVGDAHPTTDGSTFGDLPVNQQTACRWDLVAEVEAGSSDHVLAKHAFSAVHLFFFGSEGRGGGTGAGGKGATESRLGA
jgi:hypothetical protein